MVAIWKPIPGSRNSNELLPSLFASKKYVERNSTPLSCALAGLALQNAMSVTRILQKANESQSGQEQNPFLAKLNF